MATKNTKNENSQNEKITLEDVVKFLEQSSNNRLRVARILKGWDIDDKPIDF